MKERFLKVMPVLLLAFILVFVACEVEVTIRTPVNTPANTSETAPHALTEGVWFNGELAEEASKIWFSFPVTTGNSYTITQNEKYRGDGTKTADIGISVKYQGSSSFFIGTSTYGREAETETFTAGNTGTVLILVQEALLPVPRTGTFGIKIETATAYVAPNGTEAAPFELLASSATNQNWEDGEITVQGIAGDLTTGAVWYSFEVNSGTRYNVFWDDDYSDGSGLGTVDVCVAAKYAGPTGTWIFGGPGQPGQSSSNRGVDTGFNNIARPNSSFIATQSGTVLIRVLGETVGTGGRTGFFGIAYTIGDVGHNFSISVK